MRLSSTSAILSSALLLAAGMLLMAVGSSKESFSLMRISLLVMIAAVAMPPLFLYFGPEPPPDPPVPRRGDSVRVKVGVRDPDSSAPIGGWQGRVRNDDGEAGLEIDWDSVTLRGMGMDAILRCARARLDWRMMTLYPEDVEKVAKRDSREDVAAAIEEIRKRIEAAGSS